MTWTDAAGREIKPGDIVAYTVSAGRSSIIKWGIWQEHPTRPALFGLDVWAADPDKEDAAHDVEIQTTISLLNKPYARVLVIHPEMVPGWVRWILEHREEIIQELRKDDTSAYPSIRVSVNLEDGSVFYRKYLPGQTWWDATIVTLWRPE